MRVFHCDHCAQLLFFENTTCVNCHRTLAYVPELGAVVSLDPIHAQPGVYGSPLPNARGRRFKLCNNYMEHNTCNHGMDADDPRELCRACRLTRTIPDLSRFGHYTAWSKLETAKRRLLYTLNALGLPVISKEQDPDRGLQFDFMADPDDANAPQVNTGHENGVITVNLAEADDAERERRRQEHHEPYRTLLGHFRHEVGHYYWSLLVSQVYDANPQARLDRCRALFGDDREDYQAAMQRYYEQGAPADWRDHFISAYATMHPWEDFAETWAHYLHIIDTLQTAATNGLGLHPDRDDEPRVDRVLNPIADPVPPLEKLIEDFTALTYTLNNLNRGMGINDAYPFVLSGPAREKLQFVHDVIHAQ